MTLSVTSSFVIPSQASHVSRGQSLSVYTFPVPPHVDLGLSRKQRLGYYHFPMPLQPAERGQGQSLSCSFKLSLSPRASQYRLLCLTRPRPSFPRMASYARYVSASDNGLRQEGQSPVLPSSALRLLCYPLGRKWLLYGEDDRQDWSL